MVSAYDASEYFDRLTGGFGTKKLILLLGEGNFSFSSALVEHYRGTEIFRWCAGWVILWSMLVYHMGWSWVIFFLVLCLIGLWTWRAYENDKNPGRARFFPTTIESRQTVQRGYKEAARHIEYLERQGCVCDVRFEVDATMHAGGGGDSPREEFDRIVFNFPWIRASTWVTKEEHSAFLNDILSYSKRRLGQGGEIWLTLCNNQTWEWRLMELVERNDLQVIEKLHFPLSELREKGYVRVRGNGIGSDFKTYSCFTYILKTKTKKTKSWKWW